MLLGSQHLHTSPILISRLLNIHMAFPSRMGTYLHTHLTAHSRHMACQQQGHSMHTTQQRQLHCMPTGLQRQLRSSHIFTHSKHNPHQMFITPMPTSSRTSFARADHLVQCHYSRAVWARLQQELACSDAPALSARGQICAAHS
jgi:hypothetical protein